MRRGKRRTSHARQISLAFELEELGQVLESAHILVGELVIGHLPNEEAVRRTPALVEALLGLVLRRLRDIGRVAEGSLPASMIWTQMNDATGLKTEHANAIVLAAELEC